MVNYLVKQAKELIALWQVNSNPYNILVHIVCVCVCVCVRVCVCLCLPQGYLLTKHIINSCQRPILPSLPVLHY